MIINNNIPALNTHRQLGVNQGNMQNSMEKLSSGLRINRAGDDAAGLAISEKMRGQIRGLDQASRNAQDGISMIQTAEGALSETHDILQRMRELSVQSANDTNTDDDRDELQKEVEQLQSEIDRISENTEFNDQKLLNGGLGGTVDQDITSTTVLDVNGIAEVTTSGAKAGTYTISAENTGKLTMSYTDNESNVHTQEIDNTDGAQTLNFSKFGITIETNAGYTEDNGVGNVEITSGSANFQIGANKDQNIQLSINDMGQNNLGINNIDISSQEGANAAIESLDSAIKDVSAERSKLGAVQNRLDHTISNLDNSSENLSAAESRIRDVDMAKEMMEMTRANILSQASQSMLAQANQQPQSVLQLLG
ncbi:flagellin [Alteribacillus sp. HJP-4]|uniref:flagellin N-terminal helical domain-containing protein n=1 Tax=Alteribacillus sp. HJP-4 TaxID=2775394 RepID=UPI0035CD2161